MSQFVRPGTETTTYVNDVIAIITPTGQTDYGTPSTPLPVEPQTLGFYHVQNVASDTWTITHNLEFFPNVTVQDSGGTTIEGEIEYLTLNTIRLTFSSAFSGHAYLS